MLKRGIVLPGVLFFALIFAFCFASAEDITVSEFNSTLSIFSVSEVNNYYAYEVNLNYSGAVGSYSVVHSKFVGSDSVATYGASLKNGVLSVYGSRLDSAQAGVNGSGVLFNLTHPSNVDVDLIYTLGVTTEPGDFSTETYVYYNNTVTGSPVTTSVSTSTSSGGGGGGGGSSIVLSNVNLVFDSSEVIMNLVAGVDSSREINIRNAGDSSLSLSFYIETLSGIINLPNGSFSLAPGDEEKILLNIRGVKRGLLVGKLLVRAGGVLVKEIPITINVKSDNFLFDTSLIIPEEYRVIKTGDRLRAQVDLKEVVSGNKLDVVANYVIKDFSGRVYLEESETFFVEDSKGYAKDFLTSNLPPGKYILGIEVIYPGAFATSSAQFEIYESMSFGTSEILIISLITGIIVLSVVIYLLLRKKKRVIRYGRK